ncbi:hypothetical protein N7532_002613 [Penicillium argentinense]|uniref:Uncharacterized protein n=1 Tax=Penicillium argentinense TaxID=1131581 RepID=A0A9W9G105_9EURO|nr:uncharacterized protein N7532_002613 [Penicillium argentinense]KAJ5109968.1 hypothetical protein N7532_002613 [Penicillium argentinense]
MKLLHHYLLITSHTLTRDSRVQYFWQFSVPHVATSHGYVMDMVLAIAALHLASWATDATESQNWLRPALQYNTQALPTIRKGLTISYEEGRRDPLDDFLEARVMSKMSRYLEREAGAPQNVLLDTGLNGGHTAVYQEESYDPRLVDLHRCIVDKLGEFSCLIRFENPDSETVVKNAHQLLKEAIQP